MPDAAELHDRHQPDHADGQRQRRAPARTIAVFPDAIAANAPRGKADRRGHPAAGNECRMKGAAEEIIFAAGARKHRAELAVGKHPHSATMPPTVHSSRIEKPEGMSLT